ncbi:hypothetical protein GVX82_03345 [Patescibacteria group bacterium]|jgi:hypothetical protein|nr:hypothetical protein [Patescibacteria group bacterium]
MPDLIHLTILYLALLAVVCLSYLALMEAIGKHPREEKLHGLLKVAIASALLASVALVAFTLESYLPQLAYLPESPWALSWGKPVLDALILLTPALAYGARFLARSRAPRRHLLPALITLHVAGVASILGLTYLLGVLLAA